MGKAGGGEPGGLVSLCEAGWLGEAAGPNGCSVWHPGSCLVVPPVPLHGGHPDALICISPHPYRC